MHSFVDVILKFFVCLVLSLVMGSPSHAHSVQVDPPQPSALSHDACVGNTLHTTAGDLRSGSEDGPLLCHETADRTARRPLPTRLKSTANSLGDSSTIR